MIFVFNIGNYVLEYNLNLWSVLLLVVIVLLVIEFYLYDKMNIVYYLRGIIVETKEYKYDNKSELLNNVEEMRRSGKYLVKSMQNLIMIKIMPSDFNYKKYDFIPLNRICIFFDENEKKIRIDIKMMYSAVIVPVYQVMMSIYILYSTWEINDIFVNIMAILMHLLICYWFLYRVLYGQIIKPDNIAAILKLPGTILFFDQCEDGNPHRH